MCAVCEHMPASMLIGLPPAMAADDTDSFGKCDERVVDLHPPWWAKISGDNRAGKAGVAPLNERGSADHLLNVR